MLKAPPGIGKSKFFINQPEIVIGFPEHFLKDEQFQASGLPSQLKVSSPQLKGRFSKPVEDYFLSLYSLDLTAKVHATIKSLAQGNQILSAQTNGDIDAANGYLDDLLVIKQDPSASVFTTHSRAIREQWHQPIVVLDEDPMKTIFEMHEAKVSELKVVAEKLKYAELQELLTAPEEEVMTTPSFQIDDEALYNLAVEEKFSSHVIRFFSSDWCVVKDGVMHYFIDNRKYFSDEKQYIILDGSACKRLYEAAFGDRLLFHELPDTKYTGTIRQHTTRSCSMTGLNEYLNKLEIDTSNPTITFKSFKSKIPNSCDEIHYGATRGSNRYTGQNLNVVGTYRYPPTYYLLLSEALRLSASGFQMQYQNVSYEGREFMFYTYNDSTLQRIHLEMIEGELLQAVHRSRLLRYDATVTLFSGFPLSQAHYVY